jgi:proline-specific permease ProY
MRGPMPVGTKEEYLIMQSIKNSGKKQFGVQKKLNAYSFAGLGIGSIIGSGFFLGSAIPIQQAGPSVILAFLLCGFLFSQVLGAITSVSVNRPVTGSFKVYAEQFMGKYFGFLTGWVLFCSSILTVSSEAIAAGIFLRYWFPQVPLAPLSCLVMVLVIFINRLNTENFGLVESGMAAVKIFAVLFFIISGFHFLASNGIAERPSPFQNLQTFFPNGILGFLQSTLVVIFTYAGVSTIALAASKVDQPRKNIPKATIVMAVGTILIYTITTFLIICIVHWNSVDTKLSPMVQALNHMGFNWASSLINAVVFVAALSVMVGSYFGSMQVLASLSEAGEAPPIFNRTTAQGFFHNAWVLCGILSFLVAAASFLVSSKLFNYLISASSFFTFYNWTIIILIYWRWLRFRDKSENFVSPLIFGKAGGCIALILLAVLAVSSLFVEDFRIGFYTAVLIVLVISIAYFIWMRKGTNSVKTEG